MPFWEGKLVTTAEYRKLKNKKPTKKEVSLSSIGKEVYWLGPRDDSFPLWEGIIIKEDGEELEIDAFCRSFKMNPDRKRAIVKKNINDITFEK